MLHIKKFLSKKTIMLMASLVLALVVTIGVTVAFLIDDSEPVVNTFEPTQVTSSVVETLSNGKKTDVKIQNDGNIDAFIRADVIVNWVDADGNVLGTPVKTTDYSISGLGTGWKASGDYYYYTSKVTPGSTTDVMFSEIKLADNADVPDGASLSVEIICSAIQAEPISTVTQAWRVNPTTLN